MSDPFSLVGSSIEGRYRIDAVIGEGGFGVVYRGMHQRFDHPIAVKCLKIPNHFTPDAKAIFLQRFREEGKILLKLADVPGVPRVYDYGLEIAGREIPYLVLEWLDGETVEHALERRKKAGMPGFPPGEALSLILPAVDAIAVAHANHIAHRDIKPANLFLATVGGKATLKVLDFGIAKAVQEGEMHVQAQTKTATSFRAYTPNYAAPEQFATKRFGASGPWTDVHALGLVLVELLTGRPANPGDDLVECLEVGLSPQRPSPQRMGVAISPALEAVIQRALAVQPADRFPTGSALAEALRSVPEAQGLSVAAGLDSVRRQPGPSATTFGAPAGMAPAHGGHSTDQPVMQSYPQVPMAPAGYPAGYPAGPVGYPPQPPPPRARSLSMVPVLVAGGAVVALGVVATVAVIGSSAVKRYGDLASSSKAAAGSEIVLARSVVHGREVRSVLLVDEAAVKGQHHVRITRQGGKVTRAEAIGPAGTIKSSATYEYPAEGGWVSTVKDSRGTLVETVRMSKDGLETHQARSGSPFVKGCSRLSWTFHPSGAPHQRTCQDASGKVIIDQEGCPITRDEVDARLLVTGRACLSAEGAPQVDSNGIHRTAYTHDDRGNAIRGTFLGAHAEATPSWEGCLEVQIAFDPAGNETERRCVGAAGATETTHGTKLAFVRRDVDERGCELRQTRFDASGGAILFGGAAAVVMTRDEHCSETSRATVDPRGAPVAVPGDAAKNVFVLDAEGKVTERRCFDVKEQPMNCEGEATAIGSVRRFTYDDRGREISQKSFDAAGAPTDASRGYPHETRTVYDERGLVAERSTFGADGKPAPSLGTVARRAYGYDALGAQTSDASYGVDGQPVVGATLIHEIVTTYDERHQIKAIVVRDVGGGHPPKVDLFYLGMSWPKTAVQLEVVREGTRAVQNLFYDATAGNPISTVDCRSMDTPCVR